MSEHNRLLPIKKRVDPICIECEDTGFEFAYVPKEITGMEFTCPFCEFGQKRAQEGAVIIAAAKLREKKILRIVGYTLLFIVATAVTLSIFL